MATGNCVCCFLCPSWIKDEGESRVLMIFRPGANSLLLLQELHFKTFTINWISAQTLLYYFLLFCFTERCLTDLRHQKDQLLGTESCVSVTCWNGVTVRLSPCLLLAGLQHLQRWFQGIAGYLHGKKHFCVSFQHTNWSVRSSLLRPVIRSFWHPKPLLNKLVKVTRPLHAVSLVQNFYTFLQFGNLQLTL